MFESSVFYRVVKLADSIPWDIIEDRYAKKFVKNGHPAYSARIALGSLLIKQRLNCFDEWVVKHIQEYKDICDRNIVEAKIGLGKRAYGLGLIKTKLAQTTRSAVALSVLMMNIVKAALTYLRFWLVCLEGVLKGN